MDWIECSAVTPGGGDGTLGPAALPVVLLPFVLRPVVLLPVAWVARGLPRPVSGHRQ